jgi:DNA helicase-2/ATP-dependent DNA helicase PcrA
MLSDHVPELAPTVLDPATLVSHSGSPLLVLGSAGSGKTRLILDRFLWLVEQGTLPERIVLLLPSAARAEAARAALEAELHDGYSELVVVTAPQLADAVLRRSASRHNLLEATLSAGDRLAMLAERIDELPLQHHDIGGNAGALLGGFVRRIDRLKAELIDAPEFAAWAQQQTSPREREFAAIFEAHNRMVRELGACDEGDVVRLAIRLLEDHPSARQPFQHVLIDDAQELDLGPATLARTLAGGALTAAGDPLAAVLRFRGAGAARLQWFETPGTRVARLLTSYRCPSGVRDAAFAAAGLPISGSADRVADASPQEEVCFWQCENERSQAQAVAAEIERLVAREQLEPGRVAVIVGDIVRDGQAVAVALEERAVPHRVVGDAAFFQRAEVRDVLAWLRLLADPGDAPAVVRALARAPIELRSIDIARCTQIARRRKLDMVAALAAATESPQVPPEARERIRVFLKLYRACAAPIDTMRPDLYVHRLIERLGLGPPHQLAAKTQLVERLRALARFGELAAAHVVRTPQATAREFARSIAAVAEWGLSDREEPQLTGADAVQVVSLEMAGGLEVDHVFVLGLRAGLRGSGALDCEPVPDALLHESLPADDEAARESRLGQRLYVAITRARERAVLVHTTGDWAGPPSRRKPLPGIEAARAALGGEWLELTEDLFGPAETLHSTYRLLRDELTDGTKRAAGRLAELRLDTDLDISHAVVRYLEMLKLAALIARDEGAQGQGLADALRDINARIEQAVTADQREIFASSPLDDYLLDADGDVRHRARVIAVRDEPSLERFLPMRGGGVMLSASDIETYRACPLRYKFARVFRIPQEPTLHQRFGIAVHQVLERYHVAEDQDGSDGAAAGGSLTDLLMLLEVSWRRGGFGDSDEERQLHQKAVAALTRYHERAQSDQARPVWFERQFSFKLGPHLVRGRVDRVDRLPSGEYELIDYKTGRPKSAEQLVNDVQLSLYAIAAREAWGLEANHGAYYYLLDDEKVAIAGDAERSDWIRGVASEVAEGIKAQEFEPTPSPRACKLCDYRLVCPAVER